MVRKELSNLYSVEWRHKGDGPDSDELFGHYNDAWCRGGGLIQHSCDVQEAALSLAPGLLEHGLIQDLPQWFRFLHQLDVLSSQAAWLVLNMVSFKRLPMKRPLDNQDLKSPAAGSLTDALTWVPACTAVMAYQTLMRTSRDWLTNTPDMVAAQEALQLLTSSASRSRRKAYPLTLSGMSALVRDFGTPSPGLLLPGPWVSPELQGARFPASDDVFMPLMQGVGDHYPLVSLLDKRAVGLGSRGLGSQELRLIATAEAVPGCVSRSDPAAILIAMLEAELQRQTGQDIDAIYMNTDGWLVDIRSEMTDLPDAATRRWLEEWAERFDHHEADWRRAVEAMSQPRRGFRPLVITANRSEPQWYETAAYPLRALDQYWADIVEINPRQPGCLAIAGNRMKEQVPDSTELLQTGGLKQAHLVETETAPQALGACLANQDGLNLLLASIDEASSMEGMLRNALSFTEAQTLDDEPAPWLGLPLVSSYQPSELLSLADALLEMNSDLVSVMLPPDANTAMACLKSIYGLPGVVSHVCLPDAELPVLSSEQAGELVRYGAVCLSGNCAAELQLVASGGFALQDAQALSQRLKQDGVAHSLVYVLEPARLPQWLGLQDGGASLFPEQVRQRWLMTDLAPDGWLNHALESVGHSGIRVMDDLNERQALIGKTAFY